MKKSITLGIFLSVIFTGVSVSAEQEVCSDAKILVSFTGSIVMIDAPPMNAIITSETIGMNPETHVAVATKYNNLNAVVTEQKEGSRLLAEAEIVFNSSCSLVL